MAEMEEQLSRLFDMAAGEPPQRVSVERVRRQAAKSRAAGATAAVTAVLLAVGVAVAVAGKVHGPSTPSGPGTRTSVPPFYVVQSVPANSVVPDNVSDLVRATATGAVRARLRCPDSGGGQIQPRWIAFFSSREFFVVCQKPFPLGSSPAALGRTRLYLFTLTRSGRVASYSPVPGGALAGLWLGGLAASQDGTRIVVTVDAGSADHGAIRAKDVLVINTRTGQRSVWHGIPQVRGRPYYAIAALSLTTHGTELAYLVQPLCGHGEYPCNNVSEEIRTIRLTPDGGSLAGSQVVLRQSAIMRLSQGYIEDAEITPDGRALTLVIGRYSHGTDAASISVVQYSASTRHRLRVVYLRHTGAGYTFDAFAADASGARFMLDAGQNGWIDHGQLIPLPPSDMQVTWEAW